MAIIIAIITAESDINNYEISDINDASGTNNRVMTITIIMNNDNKYGNVFENTISNDIDNGIVLVNDLAMPLFSNQVRTRQTFTKVTEILT